MIQPMGFAHLPQVLDVEARAYPWPWTEPMFVDSLRQGHFCTVAVDSERLLGYCVSYVAVGECHILNICVDPQRQRTGVGRSLLQNALEHGRDQVAEAVFLEVRPSNQAAIELYEQSGFERVGVRKDYYPSIDRREDAWVYRLPLNGLEG